MKEQREPVLPPILTWWILTCSVTYLPWIEPECWCVCGPVSAYTCPSLPHTWHYAQTYTSDTQTICTCTCAPTCTIDTYTCTHIQERHYRYRHLTYAHVYMYHTDFYRHMRTFKHRYTTSPIYMHSYMHTATIQGHISTEGHAYPTHYRHIYHTDRHVYMYTPYEHRHTAQAFTDTHALYI